MPSCCWLDGKRVLTGSMNIDRSAFDLRRELGCLVDDKEVVERLQDGFQAGLARAARITIRPIR